MSFRSYERYTAKHSSRTSSNPEVTFDNLSAHFGRFVVKAPFVPAGLQRRDAVRLPPGTKMVTREGVGDGPGLTRSNAVRRPRRATVQHGENADTGSKDAAGLKRSKTTLTVKRAASKPKTRRASRFVEHLDEETESVSVSSTNKSGNGGNLLTMIKRGLKKVNSRQDSFAGVQMYEGT